MLTGPPPKFHGTRDILDLGWKPSIKLEDGIQRTDLARLVTAARSG